MELPGKSKKTQKICECSDGYEDGLWKNGGKKKWEKENEKKPTFSNFILWPSKPSYTAVRL